MKTLESIRFYVNKKSLNAGKFRRNAGKTVGNDFYSRKILFEFEEKYEFVIIKMLRKITHLEMVSM